MSAAGRQNGSELSTDTQDPAVLRVSLRCGRSLPALHLVESDEAFTQRHHHRDLTVLCGADMAAPTSDAEDLDCPGCRDCLSYCPDCVREAHRFSAESPPEDGEAAPREWQYEL